MENIISNLKEIIKNSNIEKYSNIVYQIKNDNQIEKEKLKSLLSQGDSTKYHTVVEIDFTNSPIQRKKNRNKKIEETFLLEDGKILIKIYNSPIYIYGKYIKLSREMCQTPLFIDGKFKTDRNVSDFIHSFGDFFGGSPKFMGCGREDIDVRCLEGRPFIIEISNPTRNLNNINLDIKLYEDVDILDCSIVNKRCKDLINCSEPEKFYNLLIYSDKKINFDKKYRIQQKTPLRVLHRRPNIIREKTIEIKNYDELQDHDEINDGFYYDVKIKASSGAYIKEWVNGDFDRTIPNLDSDLLELDILKVDLEIPDEFIIKKIVLNKQFE